MKHILSLVTAALALVSAPALAQTASSVQYPAGWAPGTALCVKQVDGTCTTVTATNGLPVSSPATTETGTAAQTVQGNVASGATDSGNPVKIGGVASTAGITAVTAGQRVNATLALDGFQLAQTAGTYTSNDGNSNSTIGLFGWFGFRATAPLVARLEVFNGSTFDRMRGDTTGLWTVAKGTATLASAQVSVGTSATSLVAARTGRARVIVSVGAANQCYLGGSGVTTSTGFALPATAGATLTLSTAAQVYAVCASTTTLSALEEY